VFELVSLDNFDEILFGSPQRWRNFQCAGCRTFLFVEVVFRCCTCSAYTIGLTPSGITVVSYGNSTIHALLSLFAHKACNFVTAARPYNPPTPLTLARNPPKHARPKPEKQSQISRAHAQNFAHTQKGFANPFDGISL
jgi:hypothetical protein